MKSAEKKFTRRTDASWFLRSLHDGGLGGDDAAGGLQQDVVVGVSGIYHVQPLGLEYCCTKRYASQNLNKLSASSHFLSEYRNKSLTRLFGGNARAACYFLAFMIFSFGMLRDSL